ncbi:MAG: carboxypeptidase-like regulatory domain-containing protein, partial [Bacteroidota bacterium]
MMTTTTITRTIIFLLFTIISVSHSFGQIEGIVMDAETKAPLAFAHVIINDTQEGTLTDIDGRFQLTADNIQYLTVSYIGYETRKVEVATSMIDIQLKRSSEILNEIVIYEGENPAIPIMERAIERKNSNNPENLPYFRLESYNKFIVDAERNTTDISADTSFLRNSNLFLMESVTEKK